jgi:FAD/FMN-containing dehydrogenase
VIYLLAAGPAAGLRELFSQLVGRWGRAQLLAAAPEVRAGLPIWGAAPPGLELMRMLKAAIDPDNRLCPGSFIV